MTSSTEGRSNGENSHTIANGVDREVDHVAPDQEKPTPLPVFQLFIVFLIQFAEPVTATAIYPFVIQFVKDTGVTQGDERKTGYFAGIIESTFFFAECLTVVQWGYLADRFGRRPILMLGPLGLAIGMLLFGLSTTFWPLVFSRALQGVFNGNIGVSKSVMAEITDSTNIGDAIAFIPLMWSTGVTIGPIMGGMLSNSATRWPNTLGRIHLLKVHPYLLPCAVASCIAFGTFVIAAFGLKETLPSLVAKQKRENRIRDASNDLFEAVPSEDSPLITHEQNLGYGTDPASNQGHRADLLEVPTVDTSSEASEGLRAIFTRPLLIIFINLIFLALLEMSYSALLPLVYSTSIEFGGLGLDPFHIGVILGTFGFINSFVQMYFLGQLIRAHGPRKLFIVSFSCFIVSFSSYPVMSFFARRAGRVDTIVIACICIQFGFQMMIYMAFGSLQVLLVQSIPEGGPMGMVNGVAQMLSSGTRSIAPTFASSLFSVSLQRQLLGGNLVYLVLIGLVLAGIQAAQFLSNPPEKKENRRSQQST
ncbi:unnamed protein product [Cyclocybe aegerita]|uniref:Major facilitator superfamily (MFS) profile domain-containing protein n=1 Tax=Cyclocybe aegerita TaxID=1973307 RepID=A0A8S0X4E4_CYCAE|nr:unnamed protein product [Cyclocybe aegerita]